MFKISNNLPEVFLKSPDELARCVRLRGGGVLRDRGDLTRALASSSQEMVAFLVRTEPGESYMGQGYTGQNGLFGVGGKMCCTPAERLEGVIL